ncbi:unnamed protein product, partial [Ectocarpus sp. 12 AP-2014]
DAAQAADLAPAAVAATTAAAAAHEYTGARTGITLEKGLGGMDDAGTGTARVVDATAAAATTVGTATPAATPAATATATAATRATAATTATPVAADAATPAAATATPVAADAATAAVVAATTATPVAADAATPAATTATPAAAAAATAVDATPPASTAIAATTATPASTATATATAAATTSAPSAVPSQPAVLVPDSAAATVTDGTRRDLAARFESFISHLDEGTREVLMGLLETNSVLDGIESFGKDGKDEGLNNGLFCCLLRKDTAPEEDRSRRPCPFWSNGPERKGLSENVFIACTKAKIPLVLEGDAPEKSPMGEMMQYAAGKGVARLGYIGKTSGRGPLALTPDLTDAWRTGAVTDQQLRDTLNGGTFTIDNTEENKLTDRTCYATLENDTVTAMIREGTRMGELCFPRRGNHQR